MVATFVAMVSVAAVKLPNVLGNNMVLQQGQRVPVWGKADPGEVITVSFAGKTVRTITGTDGKWKLYLDPMSACAEPRDFTVNEMVLTNVVVGEVWFCSGQSNMEYTMSSRRKVKNWEIECAAARYPLMRHFNVDHKTSRVPLDDVPAKWVDTTPETIPPQSAVAYMFGETLMKELQVPIGLINSSWGGTRIEPWTPAAHPDDLYLIQNLGHWHRAPDVPTVLWNGMVAGLCPFAIKGAIWYQGCSNYQDGHEYLNKTVALVRGWRREWGQGDFPYFLVQLAPYRYNNAKDEGLAIIQEAQSQVPSRVANSGYTVINDVGDVKDIHPTDKRTVGMRVAYQALDRVYGRFVRPWKTPILKSCKSDGKEFRVTFENAAGLKTRDGLPPNEFEIRDLCGKWVPADARIDGSDVVLFARGVENPQAMRFAAYNGSVPNLVNGDGLPAGPCRGGIQLKIGMAEKLHELDGFTCVQRYDIPACCDMRTTVPKVLARVDGVSRVAYLLELQDHAGNTTFAMSAMDAFAKSSDDLVLTSKPGARCYSVPVRNLTVRSNVNGIDQCSNVDGGYVEFFNCKFTAKRLAGRTEGEDKVYDYNDTPVHAEEFGYGCLQVHCLKSKSTIMAFNHFDNNYVACDVGIGKCPGDNPDWTFARNANKYKARRISVWVKR